MANDQTTTVGWLLFLILVLSAFSFWELYDRVDGQTMQPRPVSAPAPLPPDLRKL